MATPDLPVQQPHLWELERYSLEQLRAVETWLWETTPAAVWDTTWLWALGLVMSEVFRRLEEAPWKEADG